jgi:quinol monooxygenase YgiN
MERITPKVALFARLEAKPGKEGEVAKFLEAGLAMAKEEPTTPLWFALRLGPTTFGVFDAFADENGRQTHLNGPIAKALVAKAPELFAKAPAIELPRNPGFKASSLARQP